MWNKTKAAQLIGIKYPIIQGPFGGRFSSASLVAAVSNSGGMGSFGLNAYGQEEIQGVNAEIRALTNKPYALNLWVPLKDDPAEKFTQEDFEAVKAFFKPFFKDLKVPLSDKPSSSIQDFESQVEALLKAKPPVASFIFGVPPKEVFRELKQAQIRIMGTATTLEEALLLEEAGVELLVASGMEAGGHRASFLKTAEESLTGTFSLLMQVVEKVKIPVIAAGGIADGYAIHRALKSGASGVQIGTAFLVTEESNASQEHKSRLLEKKLITTLTKVYTGRLARLLSNPFIEEIERREDTIIAPYPFQSMLLSPLWKASREQGIIDNLPFYSGEPSSILKCRSAEKLFQTLIEGVEMAATGTINR